MNRCRQHPRYLARRKPRTLCEACWRMWVLRDFGETEFRQLQLDRLIEKDSVRVLSKLTKELCKRSPWLGLLGKKKFKPFNIARL